MGRPEDCFLGLGSNQGDSRRHLRLALAALGRLSGVRLLKASSLYRSAPLGRKDQRDFLNAVVRLRTTRTPMGLLLELKRLEAARGRKPGGPRWGPRPLDCDILFFGSRRLRSRWLTLPHPRAARRLFVLRPLAEIAPDLPLPGLPGRTPAARLARLNASGQDVRILTR